LRRYRRWGREVLHEQSRDHRERHDAHD
jgi:hypothetical protein